MRPGASSSTAAHIAMWPMRWLSRETPSAAPRYRPGRLGDHGGPGPRSSPGPPFTGADARPGSGQRARDRTQVRSEPVQLENSIPCPAEQAATAAGRGRAGSDGCLRRSTDHLLRSIARIWASTAAAALRRAGLADHTAGSATPAYTSSASTPRPAVKTSARCEVRAAARTATTQEAEAFMGMIMRRRQVLRRFRRKDAEH